jgi:hypothetical protein
MNTRQSRIILFALLVVCVGASQATAHGLTEHATQPVVEATTKAAASGVFNVDGTLQQPSQKPTPWWWEWLRFAGGGR